MSRKFIISEDERARILGLHETAKSSHGTVISEQSIGVGFMSGEPNGLKIKKEEPTEQQEPKTTASFNPPASTPNSAYLSIVNNMLPEQGIAQYGAEPKKDTGVLNGISNEDFAKLQKGLIAYNSVATNKINLPIAMQNWKEWYVNNIGWNPESNQAMTDEQLQKANQIWVAESAKLKALRPAIIEIAKLATTNPNLDIQNLTVNSPDYAKKNAFKKAAIEAASSLGVDYNGLRTLASVYGAYSPIQGNRATRAWFPTA